MGTSKELSIDVKELVLDLNKSGRTVSKQIQVPTPTRKQFFASLRCMAQLRHCHDQVENINYHLLLGEYWSGWAKINQKPNEKQVVDGALVQTRLNGSLLLTCTHTLTYANKPVLPGEEVFQLWRLSKCQLSMMKY